MSTEPNPFADRDQYSPPPRRRNPMVIVAAVLGIAFLAFLFLVGGVAMTVYRHARPSPAAALPPRPEDFRTEFREFEASVEMAFNGVATNEGNEIEEAVRNALAKNREGGSVPFNIPMFIESVMRSPYADGIDFRDQLLLRNSLTLYPPEVFASDYERILSARTDPENPKLATADLFLYTSEDQAVSTRAYLVRTGRGWEVYDMLKLEDGLRVSDEYASYFAAEDDSLIEESGVVVELIEEATIQYEAGDIQAAMATMRRAEAVSVEPASKTFAKLQIAYSWMSMEDYVEAQRVLLSIEDPEACWGVWPNLAICSTYLDDYEQAKQYADRAAAQCAHHPNVEWILSTCYAALERGEDAADAMANALRMLPADQYFFLQVSDGARIKDLPLLLECLNETPNAIDSRWLMLVSQCEYDSEWTDLLLNHVESNTVPNGIGEMILGHVAEREGDLETAARWSLKATRSANSDQIRRTARSEHMSRRLYGNKLPELFAESQNARESAVDIFSEAAYGFSASYEQAAQAVETEKRLANFPIRSALAGYLYYRAGDHAKAGPLLEAFRTKNTTLGAEEEWIDNLVDSALADFWLDAGAIEKYLTLWDSDEARIVQALGFLRRDAWGASAETFLNQTPGNPMIQLIGDVIRAERDIRGSETDAYQYGDLTPSRREAIGRYGTAIQDARSIFSEEFDVDFSLTASLTRLLVQSGLRADSLELDSDLQASMLDVGLRVATEFCDDAQMAHWTKQIDPIPPEELASRGARRLSVIGEFHRASGEFEEAIEAYERCASAVEPETIYLGRLAAEGLAASYFQLDQPDQATAAMQRFRDKHGEEMLAGCERCLHDGDASGLLTELRAADETNALSWLSDLRVQSRLERIPDWQIVTEAFPAFSPANVSIQSAGTLLVPTTRTIDQASIKQALDAGLASDCDIRSLGIDNGTTGWVASTTTGDRAILLVSDLQLRTDSLPSSLASALESPVREIDVFLVDHRPRATQRLFAVMHELAAGESIAAEWASNVWHGTGLQEQLRWAGRVPLSYRTLQRTLAPANQRTVYLGEVDTEKELDPMDDWATRIESAGGRLAVEIETPAQRWKETLAAVVVGIRPENDLLIVTPQEDSLIHPLIRTGATISLPYWRVRQNLGDGEAAGDSPTSETEADAEPEKADR